MLHAAYLAEVLEGLLELGGSYRSGYTGCDSE